MKRPMGAFFLRWRAALVVPFMCAVMPVAVILTKVLCRHSGESSPRRHSGEGRNPF
jgi:hypothetical protein